MPHASVIVPARNARATLPRTLAALARQDYSGEYEVIVVDDGSTDDTAELARRAPGPVTVVEQPALGPAQARNRGVARASAPLLAFCDADVFPTDGWLRTGIAELARSELVQGRVIPDPSAPLGPFDRTIWITSAAGLWETANLFVTRELFDRIGGFEEWLRPRSGKALSEDVWFGHRALRAGARHAFCAQALAHHAVFERDWRGYVGERRRLRYFPAMASKMPELRDAFLYRRIFLTRRSASFDLALAATAVALARRCPPALAATVPYLRTIRAGASRPAPGGPGRAAVAAADACADLVGLAALLYGSAHYRSLVL
jgi:glycosyltransferase involved in cell wall biosynthesis